jgi:hypothetical protein
MPLTFNFPTCSEIYSERMLECTTRKKLLQQSEKKLRIAS